MPRRSRFLRPALLLAGFLLAVRVPASAGVPVEGDAAALTALRDALRANENVESEHGRIEFRCTRRTIADLDPDGDGPTIGTQVAAGTVVWDGDRTRWDHRWDLSSTQIPGGDRPVKPDKPAILIVRPRTIIGYQQGGGVNVRTRRGGEYDATLAVLPRDGWFRVGQRVKRTWAEMVDAENPLPTITGYRAERDGTSVDVTILYETGLTFHLTGDVAGGFVTEYHSDPERETGFLRTGGGDWDFTDGRRPYPTRLHHDATYVKPDGGTSQTVWTLEVSRYEPDYEPKDAVFTLEGLDVPADTVVTYLDVKGKETRRVTFGGPLSPDDAADAVFDRLGDENAGGGFSGGGTPE